MKKAFGCDTDEKLLPDRCTARTEKWKFSL